MNQKPTLFSLQGQTCLVTGAGSGIGEAVAHAMSAQGATVAVNDINSERAERVTAEIKSAGGNGVCVPGDVSTHEGATHVIDETLKQFARLDILVNNAAAPVELKKFWEMSQEDWSASLSSFYATLNCLSAAAPSMMKQEYGRVVNITSIGGIVGGVDMTVYGAAKGAIHALTAGVAKELAPYNITVNCVAPGTVNTPRQRNRPPDIQAERLGRIPVGRFAESHEIAWAVIFLASREAAYITGEIISIDGGRP